MDGNDFRWAYHEVPVRYPLAVPPSLIAQKMSKSKSESAILQSGRWATPLDGDARKLGTGRVGEGRGEGQRVGFLFSLSYLQFFAAASELPLSLFFLSQIYLELLDFVHPPVYRTQQLSKPHALKNSASRPLSRTRHVAWLEHNASSRRVRSSDTFANPNFLGASDVCELFTLWDNTKRERRLSWVTTELHRAIISFFCIRGSEKLCV